MTSIYDFSIEKLDGTIDNLADYKGKTLILVNTASKCGLAPQLETLEKISNEYAEKNVVVLGFPSNQFLQETKTENIEEFCARNYGVTFLMHKPIKVNGSKTDPLFTYLKEQTGGGRITWNFTKFLIDEKGQVVKRYSPKTKPEVMVPDLEKLLKV